MKRYRIVKIEDPYNIIINGGAKNGILSNQQFTVYSLGGEELFDPDTNESLGHLEVIKGTGTVSFLEEKWCRITSDRFRTYTLYDKMNSVDAKLSAYRVHNPLFDEPVIKSPEVGDRIRVPFCDLSINDFVKPT